ncbi:hypothetical protein JIN84_05705 [Luteolibacter yonseiensis]|uniref:Uncharacterized protein n=1 Tax=Luteolibacter yonseiensis TaxID=1144680 RepID=A0A934R1B4_9BACT|nr:hypothetical protein [Luteolibacter yonseiensis]MBK1815096.1 hypothetical protein [Luteolibacter yonseiensis]
MKIYRIINDPAFHTLAATEPEPLEPILSLDLEHLWEPWISAFGRQGPELRAADPQTTRRGNFFKFHPGFLAYDTSVADAAEQIELLQDDMEYLPARLEGTSERLDIMNVMGCYNCFDHGRAGYTTDENGGITAITRYAFHPTRIMDSTIFRIPETRFEEIYVLSGRGDAEFIEFYQENGFTGLIFEEIWSDG